MSRIVPALVPVTLLLWLSLSASHWRGSLGQQLEQHLGQQLGELYRFTGTVSALEPLSTSLSRASHTRGSLGQQLGELYCSTDTAIRALSVRRDVNPAVPSYRRHSRLKSADSSADHSRGDSTREDGASAAAAGFPSSAFPRVFESGQGSCGFPDTRADADECVADLAGFPALSARSGSATVRKLACLAHNYLRPWMGIPGVTAGMGARGMISAEILHQMGTMADVPWEQKQGRAVFRGGMTNYHIAMTMHWRSSPRFRVHRMVDARPDLLDARVMSGVDVRWRESMEADGVRLGGRLKPEELQGFKYELDVDGGTGSGRTCGILASNQASEYYQFFDPLLCPMTHFLPTHRLFINLHTHYSTPSSATPPNSYRMHSFSPHHSPSFTKFPSILPHVFPLSSLLSHPCSLIPALSSLLSHPCSLIPALSSLLSHPPLSSLLSHPSSLIPPLSSLLSHPSSLIPPLSSLLSHPSSLIPPLSSLLSHPSSLIPLPSCSTLCTWEGRQIFWAILLAKYHSALGDRASITAPPPLMPLGRSPPLTTILSCLSPPVTSLILLLPAALSAHGRGGGFSGPFSSPSTQPVP
ncbi:unnamed protein product [Closterium sp. Naga37s-1]|nr:unnamed protein product [Closterium sp. Naga37s-1]